MKKQNKEDNKKEYVEGFEKVSSHHLLGCLSSMFNLMPVDQSFSQAEFNSSSFLQVNVNGNTSAIIYINKDKKLKKEEWAFIFATLFVLFAFDLYKKTKNSFVIQEKSNILFAANYAYTVLGFEDVPQDWKGYFKLSEEVTFKNEISVFEKIKEEKKLHEFLFNFLNNDSYSIIKNIKPILVYSHRGNSTKTFSEQFASNLISQAKKTVMLKAKQNFSEDDINLRKSPVYKAKNWFVTHYPLLASLASSFEVREDLDYCKRYNIEIGAVSAIDKLIVINPNARLSEDGLKFVIAHEILHIALAHPSRKKGRDHLLWNLACDFVINHWLVEMRVGVPPEGVFLDRELANKSADEIYLMISQDVRLRKKMMTLRSKKAGENFIDNNSKNGFNKKNQAGCDMLDEDTKYFSEFEDACKEALLRGLFLHQTIGRGDIPNSLEEEIKIINQPAIPWQVELARWISQRFPLEESTRTYARPSRRQSSTPDIPRARYVRPEEEKNTRTFGVIMDTSGSMDRQLLGKCLGAIVSYASAQEVKQIRLVFCDAETYDEGYIELNQLVNKVKVKGRGGTVLQQAVNYLENVKDFPVNAPILILTDGFFEPTLKVKRDHAFLLPNRHDLPIVPTGQVFEFK